MTDGERPRPIPVRELLAREAEEAAEADRADGIGGASSLPPRTLSMGGCTWTATPLGSTRTGEASDTGALLLLVRFTPEEREGDATRHDPREGFAVARSLDDVDDDALRILWERSRIVLK